MSTNILIAFDIPSQLYLFQHESNYNLE